jgi:hypothetical protein
MNDTSRDERRVPPALDVQVWASKQAWDLVALYQLDNEILKVEIHRDTSYAFQSRALVSVYDPAGRKFNLLATLPPTALQCSGLDGKRGSDREHAELLFEPDVAELLRLAELIIRPTMPGGTPIGTTTQTEGR